MLLLFSMDKKQGLRSMGKDARHAFAAWRPARRGCPAKAWRDQASYAATAGRAGTIPLSLYPDFDRRSRNRTGSADLAVIPENRCGGKRSRTRTSVQYALCLAITAGEEFRLALRTCAAGAPAAPGIYHIGGDDAERCLCPVQYGRQPLKPLYCFL